MENMENNEIYAYVEDMVRRGREACESISTYTQEQIDNMVLAVAKKTYEHAEEVAQVNFDETGMGDVAYMTVHARGGAMFYAQVKGEKSVGLIDEDPVTGLRTYAKPMGVLGCSAPSTTPIFNILFCAIHGLKSGNAIVSCPHPSAPKSIVLEVKYIREALKSVGAPEDLVQVIPNPTIEHSDALMRACDAIVAVGGLNMVKAAYSKGKPCFGVGQGNVQSLLGENYEDIQKMADEIFTNRIKLNGVPCTGEQTLWIPRKKRDEVIKAFTSKHPVVFINDPAVLDQMREKFFSDRGINRAIVGHMPKESLAGAGVDIDIPDDTRLLLVEVNSWGAKEPLAREIMFPILRINCYDDFAQAAEGARENLMNEGAGHTSGLWSRDEKEIDIASKRIPVGRLVLEQTGSMGSGSLFNGIPFTNCVSCGTWGGNSISENLTFRHFRNYTKVASLKNQANPISLDPKDVFGE